MPRLSRSVLPLAPSVAAAAALGPWGPSLDALARDPGSVSLVHALRVLAALLPFGVGLLAARFHQARLTYASFVLGALGLVLLGEPLLLEGPGAPSILLGLSLALGLASRLPERGVGSRPGLRSLGLAGMLAALPAVLAATRADDLARLLERLGPAPQPTPGLGIPWLGLVLAAAAIAACASAPGRDGDLVGPALASSLAAVIAALWLPRGIAPAIALLGGAGTLLVVTLSIAWRRGFVDDLTQLPGRRALDVALDGLSGDYVLAVIDVDHFKRFNDDHGHDAGDDALRIVARVLRGLRGGIAYRQGGEEFVAILPGCSSSDAADALDELREAIESTPLLVRGRAGIKRRALRVTASIGVAARSSANPTSRDTLRAADQALLRAKRLGRNRVELERRRSPRARRAVSA